MVMKRRCFVSCVRDFPPGCGPTPVDNRDTDEEYKDVVEQPLDHQETEDSDGPIKKAGSGPSRRRPPVVRDFPRGCGPKVCLNSEPEYPDWFDMADFKEKLVAKAEEEKEEEEEEKDEEDSVSWPPSGPPSCCSRVDAGEEKAPGLGDESKAKRNRTLASQQVGKNVVIMGLLAPKFCPWRDSNGRLKKRSSKLINFN